MGVLKCFYLNEAISTLCIGFPFDILISKLSLPCFLTWCKIYSYYKTWQIELVEKRDIKNVYFIVYISSSIKKNS